MGTPVWCEFVCRTCAKTGAGQTTYRDIPRVGMKKQAQKEGWKFKHNETFCSVFCLEVFEREEGK